MRRETILPELREKLGIEEGDLVAFIETADGILIRQQEVVDAGVFDKMKVLLEGRGFSIEEFLGLPQAATREAGGEIAGLDPEEVEQLIARTFGAVPPRRQPEDCKALRRQFEEDVAQNLRSELAAEDSPP